MFIPSWRAAGTQASNPTPLAQSVERLEESVHDLSAQTNRYRDRATLSLAFTTTAGLATLAGGALSLLSATESMGLGLAGIGGVALVGGIGLCIHSYAKLEASDRERRSVAGELFYSRKALSREKFRQLFGPA